MAEWPTGPTDTAVPHISLGCCWRCCSMPTASGSAGPSGSQRPGGKVGPARPVWPLVLPGHPDGAVVAVQPAWVGQAPRRRRGPGGRAAGHRGGRRLARSGAWSTGTGGQQQHGRPQQQPARPGRPQVAGCAAWHAPTPLAPPTPQHARPRRGRFRNAPGLHRRFTDCSGTRHHRAASWSATMPLWRRPRTATRPPSGAA
jgi:hypothetical protein